MKLVTFNIRLDWGRDGINNFEFRKPLILDKLQKEQPDIICFQEVLPHVAAWLTQSLTDYYVVGCPRGQHLDDEQTCIAFRPDAYALMKMDAYWLSPTPAVPGSRYAEQSTCPRICTEVTLLELSSKKVFRLSNTHLDHEGQVSRVQAMQQIAEKLESESFFPGIPSILTGDMNAEPDSEEIYVFSRHPDWMDLTAQIGTTYHGYGSESAQIDYIFVTKQIRCTSIRKWTDCQDGVYLSDHYPVCAELII